MCTQKRPLDQVLLTGFAEFEKGNCADVQVKYCFFPFADGIGTRVTWRLVPA